MSQLFPNNHGGGTRGQPPPPRLGETLGYFRKAENSLINPWSPGGSMLQIIDGATWVAETEGPTEMFDLEIQCTFVAAAGAAIRTVGRWRINGTFISFQNHDSVNMSFSLSNYSIFTFKKMYRPLAPGSLNIQFLLASDFTPSNVVLNSLTVQYTRLYLPLSRGVNSNANIGP